MTNIEAFKRLIEISEEKKIIFMDYKVKVSFYNAKHLYRKGKPVSDKIMEKVVSNAMFTEKTFIFSNPGFSENGIKFMTDEQEPAELSLTNLNLSKIRKDRKITQEQLGLMLSCKKSRISQIEKSQNLTLETINSYLGALGVKVKIVIE